MERRSPIRREEIDCPTRRAGGRRSIATQVCRPAKPLATKAASYYFAHMTAQQIKEAWERVPFRPFTVYMPGDRKAFVPHRDFVSLHPNGRTVIIHLENGGSRIFDTMLVTELEFADAAA